MRVSATGFARIRDHNGRYCLLVNKGRLKREGERALSPVGGAYQVDAEGMAHLQSLGATAFEKGDDLRFRIADDQVDAVAQWFAQRKQREVSVLRELTEELVNETGVLERADLLHAGERFDIMYRSVAPHNRRGAEESQTTYLIEIFDVTLSAQAMDKLLAAEQVGYRDRQVYFVLPDELVQCQALQAIPIIPISRHLLAPSDDYSAV